MGHCCILIPHPRDEEVCRGRRKLEKIPQRLHCWADVGRKLPNKVHDAEDRLKSTTAKMVIIYRLVFGFHSTSQELCLLNPDSTIAAIVKAKDQEIKELKKRVAELEAATTEDLCVLALVKADATAIKEQSDRGASCEEQGNNDGEEKERKDEEEENEEDKEMDEERKDDKDEEEEEKKNKKEDGKDEERNEKEDEKEEERKDGDGDDDEECDHDTDNEYNDMNEENQTKHRAGQVSSHHKVKMNKKFEAISRKLNFGQDVNFGEWDYKAVRTLSSIVDEKWSDLKLNVKAFEKYN
ncbi:hypothetical protein CDL12_19731 [Handroanthus impetiginosus]|uniref:Ubiquitinyl hydrolase 1 n=1 Tax=Handroanthus impetiginosus TaxID=429701 RepID=A0A2G9GR03_9LAMI|nr:hypothetical protein CDL12_19731 [Handroanthus impetiginosus]